MSKDLHQVRTAKRVLSKFGHFIGAGLGIFDIWCNTPSFSLLGIQSNAEPNRKTLDPSKQHQPIAYPKPDGKTSLDKASSILLSNTDHEEEQPFHLKVAEINLQKEDRARLNRWSLQPPLSGWRLCVVPRFVRSTIPDQRPKLSPLQNTRCEGFNCNIT